MELKITKIELSSNPSQAEISFSTGLYGKLGSLHGTLVISADDVSKYPLGKTFKLDFPVVQ